MIKLVKVNKYFNPAQVLKCFGLEHVTQANKRSEPMSYIFF